MNAHFDSIIFDLDGTLIDYTRALTFSINKVYADFGISKKLSFDAVCYAQRFPYLEFKSFILEDIPTELEEHIFPIIVDNCKNAFSLYPEEALYPDVARGIKELHQKYKLFIVSNCDISSLKLFLEKTALKAYFVDTLCHGHNQQPKATNIEIIIERHNLQTPCYIGDSSSDETAANTAQIPFFYAGYGACFSSTYSSTPTFNSFLEVINYFK